MVRRLQYRDASRVLLDYAKRPADAVSVLVQGSLWSEASRVVRQTISSVSAGSTELIKPVGAYAWASRTGRRSNQAQDSGR